MDWRSILKNASLATGLNMRSMDLDNIIEEDDDCIEWFMEFQRRMKTMHESMNLLGVMRDTPITTNQISNEEACKIKDFYENEEYISTDMASGSFGFITDVYFEEYFSLYFWLENPKVSLGTHDFSFYHWNEMFMDIEQDIFNNDFTLMLEELAKGRNKEVNNFYDAVVKVLEHINRPEIVKSFKENFKWKMSAHLAAGKTEFKRRFKQIVDENYR